MPGFNGKKGYMKVMNAVKIMKDMKVKNAMKVTGFCRLFKFVFLP
jgi:hypothetical protein